MSIFNSEHLNHLKLVSEIKQVQARLLVDHAFGRTPYDQSIQAIHKSLDNLLRAEDELDLQLSWEAVAKGIAELQIPKGHPDEKTIPAVCKAMRDIQLKIATVFDTVPLAHVVSPIQTGYDGPAVAAAAQQPPAVQFAAVKAKEMLATAVEAGPPKLTPQEKIEGIKGLAARLLKNLVLPKWTKAVTDSLVRLARGDFSQDKDDKHQAQFLVEHLCLTGAGEGVLQDAMVLNDSLLSVPAQQSASKFKR